MAVRRQLNSQGSVNAADESICDMILSRAMAFEMRRYGRKEQGMRTLREEGIIKCAQGITSVQEILDHTDRFDDD